MKPLDRLSEYLGALERRLRWLAFTRGAAVAAGAALALTVLAVLVINHYAFSNLSVVGARVLLFLGLAFAVAAALIVPVIRLNRRRAARAAEHRYPQFEERLLTFSERMEQDPGDPFLALRADDTLKVAQTAEAQGVARTGGSFRLSSGAMLGLHFRRRCAFMAWDFGPGLPGLWHGAALGRSAEGQPDALLRHRGPAGQSYGAQARRRDRPCAPEGLRGAGGTVLREVCQLVEVGEGRDGRRAGRLRLPVCDRGHSGIDGV